MAKLYKIKPLVFVELKGMLVPRDLVCSVRADTKCYSYSVRPRRNNTWVWDYYGSDGSEGIHNCKSLEDGKAQAREHYECELGEELEEVDR